MVKKNVLEIFSHKDIGTIKRLLYFYFLEDLSFYRTKTTKNNKSFLTSPIIDITI